MAANDVAAATARAQLRRTRARGLLRNILRSPMVRAVHQPRCHCWLEPPLQVHSWTRAPLAVEAPLTSRQSPDWTPVMVPLEFRFHCWLGWPLPDQMMTLVPLGVPLAFASRHMLPE